MIMPTRAAVITYFAVYDELNVTIRVSRSGSNINITGDFSSAIGCRRYFLSFEVKVQIFQ